VTVFLPPDTFANFYSILQTEEPIFVQYTLRDNDDLDVGEGPINHSGERESG
jgi:hypothetical protein